MRNFGGILLLLSIFGFVYASGQVGKHPPVPEGLTAREGLEYPAGRWDVARYACGGAAILGLLLALFPKGR